MLSAGIRALDMRTLKINVSVMPRRSIQTGLKPVCACVHVAACIHGGCWVRVADEGEYKTSLLAIRVWGLYLTQVFVFCPAWYWSSYTCTYTCSLYSEVYP